MTANEQAFDAAIAAWNAGDVAGYVRLYDETILLHGYAPAPLDRTGVAAFYREVVASNVGWAREIVDASAEWMASA